MHKTWALASIKGALCLFLFFTSLLSLSGQSYLNDIDLPVFLTHDGTYYLSSVGGRTKNGCEAWASMLNTGEYIYASRCDIERLERLGLFIKKALSGNAKLRKSRQIPSSEDYLMIDYTDIKHQALLGVLPDGAYVYIILNENKDFVFYRVEAGNRRLKELGFFIDELLSANDGLDSKTRISPKGGSLNVVEDRINGSQMLIGETNDGTVTALVVDRNGRYLGYATRSRLER